MNEKFARGEGWVAAQMIFSGLVLLAPRRGPRWPQALTWLTRPLGVAGLIGGLWVTKQAFADLGDNLTALPMPKADNHLVREGIYAEVRHPIYTGVIMVAFGWALATANTTRLVLATLFAALLKAKSQREEVWLEEKFPDYAAYREEVPGLLPSFW